MASISNAAANLYNYTAPVTGSKVVNDKKANDIASPSAVASAKFAVESTIVSIGNKNADPALTYNASGHLDAANKTNANQSNSLTSEQAAQNAILQAQSAISDALKGLSGGPTASPPSDIASLLNIPGVTTARQ
jgi:hypothetical protein